MVKCLLTSDTHYGHSGKTQRRHHNFLKEIKEKIDAGEVDVVLHAGDWTSYRQDQFKRTLEMFRRELGDDTPIMAVRGNHDFWDGHKGRKRRDRKKFYDELIVQHKQWFRDNDITYLGDLEINNVKDVAFVGFDGWYGSSNPPTNDETMMISDVEGCPIMPYMSNKAGKDLYELLGKDYSKYRKVVCVSHFPTFSEDYKGIGFSANLKYHELLKEQFDVLCFGHSHMYVKRKEDDTWIYNSGSDYDKPRYIIFEV